MIESLSVEELASMCHDRSIVGLKNKEVQLTNIQFPGLIVSYFECHTFFTVKKDCEGVGDLMVHCHVNDDLDKFKNIEHGADITVIGVIDDAGGNNVINGVYATLIDCRLYNP